jgi:hypothetical protein
MLQNSLKELEEIIQQFLSNHNKMREEHALMAQRIVDLQEKIDAYELKLKEIRELYDEKEKDGLLAGMLLDELLGSFKEFSANAFESNVSIIEEINKQKKD